MIIVSDNDFDLPKKYVHDIVYNVYNIVSILSTCLHFSEICLKSGHVQHKELSRNSGVFLSERDNKWTCNMNAPLYLQSADMIAEFCQDSASVQREFRLFLRQSSGSCGNVTVIDTDSIKCPMPNRTNCTDKELRV